MSKCNSDWLRNFKGNTKERKKYTFENVSDLTFVLLQIRNGMTFGVRGILIQNAEEEKMSDITDCLGRKSTVYIHFRCKKYSQRQRSHSNNVVKTLSTDNMITLVLTILDC